MRTRWRIFAADSALSDPQWPFRLAYRLQRLYGDSERYARPPGCSTWPYDSVCWSPRRIFARTSVCKLKRRVSLQTCSALRAHVHSDSLTCPERPLRSYIIRLVPRSTCVQSVLLAQSSTDAGASRDCHGRGDSHLFCSWMMQCNRLNLQYQSAFLDCARSLPRSC
jgi:hypothetical protein